MTTDAELYEALGSAITQKQIELRLQEISIGEENDSEWAQRMRAGLESGRREVERLEAARAGLDIDEDKVEMLAYVVHAREAKKRITFEREVRRRTGHPLDELDAQEHFWDKSIEVASERIAASDERRSTKESGR